MRSNARLAILPALCACLSLGCGSRETGSAHSVPDPKRLEEREASCRTEAQAWYRRAHANERAPASEVRDLASHYHAGSDRCLIVLTTTVVRGYVSTDIIDAGSGQSVGAYRLDAGQSVPTRCEMDGKRCSSSEAWRSLIDPYLHE